MTAPLQNKLDRVKALIDEDEALRQSVRHAMSLVAKGEASADEYRAFRRQTRAALKANHDEYMKLTSPPVAARTGSTLKSIEAETISLTAEDYERLPESSSETCSI